MRGSLTRAIRRYRALDIEFAALRVVGRGLFLVVMLMVVFLYVFTLVTDLIDGTNEVLIPTVTVNPDIDLGALAQGAFSRTSASVVSAIGAVTLVVSAVVTAQAIRQGTRRALLGDGAGHARLASWQTVAVALTLAVGITVIWMLTLATSIRQRAWVALIGRDISSLAVDAGKILSVALSVLVIGFGVLLVIRIVMGRLSSSAWVAAGVIAVVVVTMNFFLLYTYVGALINPAVSAGIVLVFTLLVWVNICVRVYLGALCWVGDRTLKDVLS